MKTFFAFAAVVAMKWSGVNGALRGSAMSDSRTLGSVETFATPSSGFGYSMGTDPDNQQMILGSYRYQQAVIMNSSDGSVAATLEVDSDGGSYTLFGQGVAIDDDYALVGAPFYDSDGYAESGAVTVFKKSVDDVWYQLQTLDRDSIESNQGFGWGVAISGEHALVVSYARDGNFFYKLNSETGLFEQTQMITNKGESAAMDGTYAAFVSGLYGGSKLYIYEFDETSDSWNQVLSATCPSCADDERLQSVSISGDRLVTGTYAAGGWGTTEDGTLTGQVFVYERNSSSGSWELAATLTPSDGENNDFFGTAVSVHGDSIAVGAAGYDLDQDDGSSTSAVGKAYLYTYSDNTWTETSLSSGTSRNQKVGTSIGLTSSNSVAIGVPTKDYVQMYTN